MRRFENEIDRITHGDWTRDFILKVIRGEAKTKSRSLAAKISAFTGEIPKTYLTSDAGIACFEQGVPIGRVIVHKPHSRGGVAWAEIVAAPAERWLLPKTVIPAPAKNNSADGETPPLLSRDEWLRVLAPVKLPPAPACSATARARICKVEPEVAADPVVLDAPAERNGDCILGDSRPCEACARLFAPPPCGRNGLELQVA